MSSYRDLCCQPSSYYSDICPEPYVDARNEPCITSCGDSTAVVHPPPVSVVFPGPILSTFPQQSVVGTTVPALPYGAGGSYGGGVLGGSIGYGGSYGGGYGGGYGGLYGYGGLCGYGGPYGYGGGYSGGYGGLCGYGRRYGRKYYSSRSGSCGPC